MDWRKHLGNLRGQFEAASSQWPFVRHTLMAGPMGYDVWRGATAGEQPSKKLRYMRGMSVRTKAGTPINAYSILYRVDPSCRFTETILSRFQVLGSAAEQTILHLPSEVLSLLQPPERSHPDAGIADDLWLGRQWMTVSRERQLAYRDKVQAAGGDTSCIPVPDTPEVLIWRNDRCEEGNRWYMLLHNLGWHNHPSTTLRAERSVSDGTMSFVLRNPEMWRELLTGSPFGDRPPAVPLPLESMQSDLNADPWLCSVWAIDMILDIASESRKNVAAVEIKLDDKGYVKQPADETAYISFTKAWTNYLAEAWPTTSRRKVRDFVEVTPSIRKWRPSKSRLSLHLADIINIIAVHPDGPPSSDGWCDDPAEVERRKAQVEPRSARKAAKGTSQ